MDEYYQLGGNIVYWYGDLVVWAVIVLLICGVGLTINKVVNVFLEGIGYYD